MLPLKSLADRHESIMIEILTKLREGGEGWWAVVVDEYRIFVFNFEYTNNYHLVFSSSMTSFIGIPPIFKDLCQV